MKRIACLTVTLLFFLSLAACESGVSEAVNPLLGTWMMKAPQIERTIVFTEDKDGTVGTYQYYNYEDNTWGEFAFKLKEQTAGSITLLIDDGTMDVMPYAVVGNRLYLDGMLFSNTADKVPTDAFSSEYTLLKDGNYYLPYKDIFMGMHMADVEQIIGRELEPETNYNVNTGHYEFVFNCPYSVSIFIRSEDFYSIDMGFDQNRRLVHLSKQGTYHADLIKNLVLQLNQDFGETYDSIFKENRMNYKWYSDAYVIELQIYWPEGFDTSQYFTITYYFTDNTL